MQGTEKKAAFLCSLLSIVSHLCKLLTDKTEQVTFILYYYGYFLCLLVPGYSFCMQRS